MLIASHNIMDGLRVGELTATYLRLARRGLALLCLQEDRPRSGALPGDHIAAALGPRWQLVRGGDGLSILGDRDRVELTGVHLRELPRLDRLSWLERRYIRSGRPEPKHALEVDVGCDAGRLRLVDFHLDTAGDNRHRARQVEAIAAGLGDARFVACGDTNAFTLRARHHRAALAAVTAGFAALGAIDPETRPTHFFARQGEPSVAHQLAAAIGRTGFDLPRRYDVICSNLAVEERGHAHTPASDHDLVWARIFLGRE